MKLKRLMRDERGLMAFKIAMFLILFNLSLGVVGALDIFHVPEGENPLEQTTDVAGWLTNWDWKSLLGVGIGLMALVASVIFRMPVGAAIFALVFTITYIPVGSTLVILEEYGLMAEITALITTGLAFVFLFGFIELSSTYTGQ